MSLDTPSAGPRQATNLASAAACARSTLPNAQEMIAARTDVWGEAALRQPGGPSYEFFRDLLPPIRYVTAEFRHYPIVLSAPFSPHKTRLVSNGSAVNARANSKMWREVGFPVTFRVGDPPTAFGQDLERLDGPRYEQGWLPIVRMAYREGEATYEQEAFAPVNPAFADCGAVLVQFRIPSNASGRLVAHIVLNGYVEAADGALRDEKGRILVLFDANWRWEAARSSLEMAFSSGRSACLAVFSKPAAASFARLDSEVYDQQRRDCAAAWEELLAKGMELEAPEPIVNNAWRALVVGNFMIAAGDHMNYSAHNLYDHLYEGESGDAVRSLLYLGFTDEARRMVGPLLDFQREDTRFTVAGRKLQLLSDYYWVTRDAGYLREKAGVWKGVVEFILGHREPSTGLMEKDNYAGDLKGPVYSLKSNAECWRGLRDIAAVMDDISERDEARRIDSQAGDLRGAILDAVARSERLDTQPPFIPMELLAGEEPYDPLTATRMGSYYTAVVPHVLGSGVFGYHSAREQWLLDYLRNHGGIAMGLLRFQSHQGGFANEPGLDDPYTLRITLAQLRRDERERALVTFYAKLAQALTRDTFIGGEGTRFLHGDERGRSMYLPPNAAGNAMFLLTLRFLLIQDWDMNEDGKPDTLRLLYAIPGWWLADGASLAVRRAPTAFGPVSIEVESRLSQGEVIVQIAAPPRRAENASLRLPLPLGWKATSAEIAGAELSLEKDHTVDVTGKTGEFTVRFQVGKDGK
ncbi:MAG: hypothetical protein NTW86_03980 [Candidatus Sumerlaeota bacterium]|nr:hypothetical protein [Candidatus Sumerlaeota bacterium]